MSEIESYKISKKQELYNRLISGLEEDSDLSPYDQVIIPGGVIGSGTPEEEEAQCKEIEARLIRKYGGKPKGTILFIRVGKIKIIG